jgi:hypothetical protein
MKCSMNGFTRSGSADSGEVKAILFALIPCLVFIGYLAFVFREVPRKDRRVFSVRDTTPPAMPVPPVRVTEPPPPPPPDMNSRFRVVPASFRGIDFATRSYGTYQSSDGTSHDLVLVDGHYREFGESQQWFDLNDVLYTDLTGDGRPEAIVMMTHLECARQCDGGKNLVYIYSHEDGILTEILKYESGSGMDGNSLKSLTVKNKQLTLELFGDGPSNDLVIRDTYKLTRVEFFFNGRKLVEKKQTVLTVPNHNEVTSGVAVHIFDGRTPDQRDL